jgi:hypothetical protein
MAVPADEQAANGGTLRRYRKADAILNINTGP